MLALAGIGSTGCNRAEPEPIEAREVQVEQVEPASTPPPVHSPAPATTVDEAPRDEGVTIKLDLDCSEETRLPALSTDGKFVAHLAHLPAGPMESTCDLALVIRELDSGAETTIVLMPETAEQASAEAVRRANVELGKRRWQPMRQLPAHIDAVWDGKPELDRNYCKAHREQLQADVVPDLLWASEAVLTCAGHPQVVELAVVAGEYVLRIPRVRVLARRPVPGGTRVPDPDGECRPTPIVATAFMDASASRFFIELMQFTHNDDCEYPSAWHVVDFGGWGRAGLDIVRATNELETLRVGSVFLAKVPTDAG